MNVQKEIAKFRKAHATEARRLKAAADKAFSTVQAKLVKKHGAEVFTSFARTVGNISCVSTGHQHLDDLVTGEAEKGVTRVGTGLGIPKGRIFELAGREGSGKAQPLSSGVFTPVGFRPIGSLRVGDVVSSPCGKTQKVVGVYPQGVKSVYRITTSDGGETRACAEHLWTVSDEKGTVRTLETKHIARSVTRPSGEFVVYQHRLPVTAPVEMVSSSSLPIHPYLLGLLLGDGVFGATILFCKSETDLHEKMRSLLPGEDELAPRVSRDQNYVSIVCRGAGRSETSKSITDLGLANTDCYNKFVPVAYLAASVEDRLALLRGLFDTDGHVLEGTNPSVEYSTSSPMLAEAVQFLVRSLGGFVQMSSRVPTYVYKGEKKEGALSWRLHVRFPRGEVLVASAKHLAKWKPKAKTFTAHRTIHSVEYVGEEECVCIKVSNEDGLYITDDFIVTHNTTLMLKLIAAYQRAGVRCFYIDAEHAVDVDYAREIGVDMDRLIFSQPSSAEEGLDIVDELTGGGAVGFGAVDSVAALVPQVEVDGDVGDQHMALQARLMSQALRKLKSKAADTGTTIGFINQMRAKIGGFSRFGPQEQTTGGNALRYFADIRFDMRVIRTIRKGSKSLGVMSRLRCIKNKVAPPFREVFVEIEFGKGVIAIHPSDDSDASDDT